MENVTSLVIGKREIAVKEHRHQRVVTFKDIDAIHERPDGTAKRNFNKNKNHFIENTDYFKTTWEKFSTNFVPNSKGGNPNNEIILITESGYLMLVKSFTDDLAWQIQRQLVNTYFRAKEMADELKHKLQERRLDLQETKMKIEALREVNRTVKSLCAKTTQSCKNSVTTKLMQSFGIDVLEEVFEAINIQCDAVVKEFVDSQCENRKG